MSMRTEEGEQKYDIAKKRADLVKLFDEEPVLDFKYWRIVENRFPHDRITTINHMIVLKRECRSILFIKPMEWVELLRVVIEVSSDYDTFTFNFPTMSSVKNIPHAHLYILKEELK